MNPPSVANQFLRVLARSHLLSPSQLLRVRRAARRRKAGSIEPFARALQKRGLLTPYQAERLLAGRSRGFFYGPYKVLDALGAGGMSRVLLAEHVETGERVALKTLSAAREHDVGFLTRLKLEARVGQMVQHPHIIRTGQLGQSGGLHYLPMEYVRGVELYELIGEGRLPPVEQICDLIRQAAEGLHAAHCAGISHRDVKPQNLLIDRSGRVKLLDFGLAHLGAESADEEFSLSMIFGHDCVGTVQYIAPEQYADSNLCDPRSDIYSLGCTLYHSLTGRLPFSSSGSTAAAALSSLVAAHRSEQPRPPTDFGLPVPSGVADIVARMMAKQPADRFQSAAEVADALASFARSSPLDVDVERVVSRRAEQVRRLLATADSGVSGSGSSNARSQRAGSRVTGSRTKTDTRVAVDTQRERGRSSGSSGPPAVAAGTSAATVSGGVREPRASGNRRGRSRARSRGTLTPSDGGGVIGLHAERVLFGRDTDCDVIIPGGAVSGRHCELRWEAGRWRVVDLNSKNGVKVNGKGVADRVLHSGDRLTIAQQVTYRMHYDERRSLFKRLILPAAAALGLIAAACWLLVRAGVI